MRERILLEGPPGSGKSEQVINIASFISPRLMYVIDLEDKMQAMLESRDDPPKNLKLYRTLSWDENPNPKDKDYPYGGLKQISELLLKTVKSGDWIGIDRVDLAWSMVQKWFAKEKFKESMAEVMMNKAKAMTKSSMFMPKFDSGSWQVINAQYDEVIVNLMFNSRCNIVMTAGIKAREPDAPLDIGRLGVLPRGQKELGHQPHSMFLLNLKRNSTGNGTSFRITTDKDLKNRAYYEDEELIDFPLQYLSNYYDPVKGNLNDQ